MSLRKLRKPQASLQRTAAVLALLLVGTSMPRGALAQTAATTTAPDPIVVHRAAELKSAGDAALDAFRFAEALAAYSQAYALTGDPAILYNKSRALEGLNDFPQALANLEVFELKASPELRARVPGLQVLISDVRARIAKLTIRCNVPGADIRLAEKSIGTTPIDKPITVNAGHSSLEVMAEGYVPYKQMQTLPGGGEISVDVTLVAKGGTGVLAVSSPIANAMVTVDGKGLGQVPVETTLVAGNHRIRLVREGYEASESTVVVAAGERKTLSLALEVTPPITQKWWFWTGIGVVALGGVALTAALLTSRSPDRGTIAPGQVSASLVRW